MAGKRKAHASSFKAQVALAAVKGDKTIERGELSWLQEHGKVYAAVGSA